jgi:hypothetical protein
MGIAIVSREWQPGDYCVGTDCASRPPTCTNCVAVWVLVGDVNIMLLVGMQMASLATPQQL